MKGHIHKTSNLRVCLIVILENIFNLSNTLKDKKFQMLETLFKITLKKILIQ